MEIYFEVSKRRYIKNNKKVLEVQIFALPFWDNRYIKWSNSKRFQKGCGDFNVDIYASETGTDRKIIIENQLEDTDHDHLGKLITYASGKGADVVIWVVKHAREEHKAAVEWLNNHTDDKIGFFLCEIKLF